MASNNLYFGDSGTHSVATAANWFTDRALTTLHTGIPGSGNGGTDTDTVFIEDATTALTGTFANSIVSATVSGSSSLNGVVFTAVTGTLKFDTSAPSTFSCSGTVANLHVASSGGSLISMTSGTATNIYGSTKSRIDYGGSCGNTTLVICDGITNIPASTSTAATIKVGGGTLIVERTTGTSITCSGGTVITKGAAKTHALLIAAAGGTIDVQSGGTVSNYEAYPGSTLTTKNNPYTGVSVGGSSSYEHEGSSAFVDGNSSKSASVVKIGKTT